MRQPKPCAYCGKQFSRLDRHHAGRNACSKAAALARTAGLAGRRAPPVEAPEPARGPDAATTSDRVAARNAAGDFVDPDGRRRIRAFDPAAAGGQPHVQGVEPTPVHPDDPEPGAGRIGRRPRKPAKQGGDA